MPELAGEAVVAVDHLAVGDESRTEPRAEGDHNEIAHALGVAVNHLADRRRVGVVGNERLHAAETLRNVVRQREHAARLVGIGVALLKLPKVRRGFDRALVVVGIGRADADARQFVLERKALRQSAHRVAKVLDISRIVVNIRVLLGRDDRFGIEVAVFIHEAESGVDAADVHADREFFHIVFQVKS